MTMFTLAQMYAARKAAWLAGNAGDMSFWDRLIDQRIAAIGDGL